MFESLVAQNQEDRSYLHGWLKAKGLATVATSEADQAKASEAFAYLQQTYPTSRAVKRLALVYIQGEAFKVQARAYIGAALQKGVPSIFIDIKSLYVDDEKRKSVEEVVEQLRTEWQAHEQVPSSYLWAVYFLAQHYSFLRQSTRALAYIDSAIAHSPTMPELHMTRARILKRSGSLLWASQAMEDARILDGQDRFLNSKAAKYLLRIGEMDQARERVGLFTKPDAVDPVSDLVEMQATWYLLEEEKAWSRAGKYAMALKRCTQIDRIFTEIWDDQLDFHSYCLRKSTLRAYANMIQFEDNLQSHPAYLQAAFDAIAIYLRLHDNPTLYKPEKSTSNGQSSEEKKKAAQKAKKLEMRAAEEAKRAAAAAEKKRAEKKTDDEETPTPPKDEDPDGETAFAAVEPLKDAVRYLTVLQRMAGGDIRTWLLTFEVAKREKNWLLATRALSHAHKIDSSNAALHVQIITLKLALPALSDAPEPVGKSIKEVLSTVIPSDAPLPVFNLTYVQNNPGRADAALAGARASILLDGSNRDAAIASILEIPKRAALVDHEPYTCHLSTLIECQEVLRDAKADEATLEAFDRLCSEVFPLADAFKSEMQREKERGLRAAERQQWDAAKADGDAAPATNGRM